MAKKRKTGNMQRKVSNTYVYNAVNQMTPRKAVKDGLIESTIVDMNGHYPLTEKGYIYFSPANVQSRNRLERESRKRRAKWKRKNAILWAKYGSQWMDDVFDAMHDKAA